MGGRLESLGVSGSELRAQAANLEPEMPKPPLSLFHQEVGQKEVS